MKTKRIDAESVAVTPQNPDDLLLLRRIIRTGDTVSGHTTWVLKQDREYSRPDKGERIRVMIAILVDKISLDSVLDRIRLGGVVLESDSDAIPHGVRHSLVVNVSDTVRISKKRWLPVDKKLLKARHDAGFVLVAIDRSECGLARLSGTHLHRIPNIYSGSGGKRYKAAFDINRYIEQVAAAIGGVLQSDDTLVLFGPGETKRVLANHLGQLHTGRPVVVAEGVDTGGEDGIHLFTRSESLKQVLSESRLARVLSMVDQVMAMAGRGGRRFTMGFEETATASQAGAIESLVYSDGIFTDRDEDEVVKLLNDAEQAGASVYGVDSTTDLGLRVTSLGGVISVLRYALG